MARRQVQIEAPPAESATEIRRPDPLVALEAPGPQAGDVDLNAVDPIEPLSRPLNTRSSGNAEATPDIEAQTSPAQPAPAMPAVQQEEAALEMPVEMPVEGPVEAEAPVEAAAASPGRALAREWVSLGELYFSATATYGKLRLGLGDVRRRGSYYEVWERIDFLPRSAENQAWLSDGEGAKVRLTLWAVRCGRGMMARLLEANDGVFAPRVESLRFYSPLPESAGATVVEAVCRVMRERAESGETPEVQEARRFQKRIRRSGLDTPPLILDAADFDEEDEAQGVRQGGG